jgi:SAM-dependent methyltransferase
MRDSRSTGEGRGHQGNVLAKAGGYDVVACETCGFCHVVPLPTAEDMAESYREIYYGDEKPAYLAEASEDQKWAALMQNDRLALMEKILGTNRRHLLDIGSGPGFFLKTAAERGWRARGIEPSRQAVRFARTLGCDVVEGFFDAESAPTLGSFDVVHLNNVLEHIPDPIGLLDLAQACIAPGGLICINVPNDFTPIQAAACRKTGLPQWWIAPPHHLNYFDFASIEALLARLGFERMARTTSFPMEMFLLMGEVYVGDATLGRACHKKRMAFDLALEEAGEGETRRAFYQALAAAGIGREVVAIARKP